VALATLALGSLASVPRASAAPTLTVDDTTVAVGGAVSFTATGCRGLPGEGPNVYDSIYAWIVSGAGSEARAGSLATPVPGVDDRYTVTVQGWVDPDDPAVLVVWCVRGDFSTSDVTWTVLEDYGDTPLDVTPAPSPVPALTVTASRTTASTGQLVRVEGTGCAPGSKVFVGLRRGTDLTLRTVILSDAEMVYAPTADGSGAFRQDIELNRNYGEEGSDAYAPLPTGPYTIVAGCQGPASSTAAAPLPLTVGSANPVGSLAFTSDDGTVTVTGEGCTDGRAALVTPSGTGGGEGRTVSGTPAADGSWTVAFPFDQPFVTVRAACGDPLGTGFRYLTVAGAVEGATTTTSSTTSPPTDPGDPPPPATPIPGTASFTG
jgi:hypothetical protein